MLVKQGTDRSEKVDLRLACTLSAVAGALNAAVLYAAGFFAANMTGNVSALSDHIALGHFATAGFYVSIVAVFIAGAMVCAIAVNIGLRHKFRGIYALMILFEALILIGLWLIWEGLDNQSRIPVLVLGLSFAMGLQNATVTRISDARVRTTHVSGMATDIGVELGILFDRLRGIPLAHSDREALTRLRLHSATIVCFLLGGIGGVTLYLAVGSALFLLCAAGLILLAVISLLKLRKAS